MPKYTQEQLCQALEALDQGLSYRDASNKFQVPMTTLCDHKKKRSTVGISKGRQTSIPKEIEDQIVKSILDSATAGFPLTKSKVLEKVGRLCQQLQLKTQFVNGKPGEKYWRCLKKRYPQLTICSPECCSHKRLANMTEEKVHGYFDDLHRLTADNHMSENDIWNMDETGLPFTHKPSRVVAGKGTKVLHSRTSDSKETVTIVVCISASGNVMPPLCIAKGKTKQSLESFSTYLGPEGGLWTYQDRGWMENSLGIEWFQEVFLKNCGPQRPQLLLVDSHSSHEVLELLEMARQEKIHIFALPPHTTQALQPLDKVVFKPFKTKYNSACSAFMNENPSKFIDKKSFPLMLSQAWEVLHNEALLKKAFSATGVYPPNRYAVSRDQFTPSQFLHPARDIDATGDINTVRASDAPGDPECESSPQGDITASNGPASDVLSLALNISGISEADAEADFDQPSETETNNSVSNQPPDVALLTNLLQTDDGMDFSQPSQSDPTEVGLLPEYQVTAAWNTAVLDIFTPPYSNPHKRN